MTPTDRFLQIQIPMYAIKYAGDALHVQVKRDSACFLEMRLFSNNKHTFLVPVGNPESKLQIYASVVGHIEIDEISSPSSPERTKNGKSEGITDFKHNERLLFTD